jgi:hypothetical protein
MNTPVVIHPFLFAIWPIINHLAYNINEVSISIIVVPIAVSTSFAFLLWLLLGLVFKDKKKAGLIVSLLLVQFFSYGTLASFTVGVVVGGYEYILLGYGLYLACAVWCVAKTRKNLQGLTTFLNIVSAVLVVTPLITVVNYELNGRIAYQTKISTNNIETNTADFKKADLPDIYYIILDRYGCSSTLKRIYDFDNSEFIDYLTNRGFYVASNSKANYLKTFQSLAASLNMEYINYISDAPGGESNDQTAVFSMLRDYKVWRFLQSRGYKYIHFGSWWNPTLENKYADINVNYFEIPLHDEFSRTLLRTTMLRLVYGRDWFRREQWKRVLYKFEKLAEIPKTEEPTFVFVHMLIPHAPYVFDQDGKFLTKEEAGQKSRVENYRNQLAFVNKKIEELFDTLLSSSRVPPIIILQADEGPYALRQVLEGPNFNWKQASIEELRRKMGILNAYYLPNADKRVLYPSISPVNSFRVIFNLYFDTKLELLPDKSYAFEDEHHIYKFCDVTDKVKGS